VNADRDNPYASPSALDDGVVSLTREEAIARLRTPAICLAVSAVGSLLWGAGAILTGRGPLRAVDLQSGLMLPAILTVLVLLPLVVITSAVNVARGRVRMWLWVAIVTGLIPLGTGCVCLNLVFAFWLLHLRLRKTIAIGLAS